MESYMIAELMRRQKQLTNSAFKTRSASDLSARLCSPSTDTVREVSDFIEYKFRMMDTSAPSNRAIIAKTLRALREISHDGKTFGLLVKRAASPEVRCHEVIVLGSLEVKSMEAVSHIAFAAEDLAVAIMETAATAFPEESSTSNPLFETIWWWTNPKAPHALNAIHHLLSISINVLEGLMPIRETRKYLLEPYKSGKARIISRMEGLLNSEKLLLINEEGTLNLWCSLAGILESLIQYEDVSNRIINTTDSNFGITYFGTIARLIRASRNSDKLKISNHAVYAWFLIRDKPGGPEFIKSTRIGMLLGPYLSGLPSRVIKAIAEDDIESNLDKFKPENGKLQKVDVKEDDLDDQEVMKCGWKDCDGPNDENLLKICARCNTQRYCSRDHQRKDWSTHKKVCNKPNTEAI